MLTDAAFDRHCFTEPFGFSAVITFFENVPGRFNIFQGSGRRSGLVKVTGNSVGYTWGVAAEEAAKRVRLLFAAPPVARGARFRGHDRGAWQPGDEEAASLPAMKLISGSGERFRDALARVIPVDEAEDLGRKFYSWRSRTAHDGVLHGTEPAFGAWSHWGRHSESAVHDFEIELYGLAAAARRAAAHSRRHRRPAEFVAVAAAPLPTEFPSICDHE